MARRSPDRERDRTLARVGLRTVGNWLRLFRKKGLEALCTLHYKGDPGELTSSQAEQLKAKIQTGRFRCARQVREWIPATFGVTYSLSGTKRLLRRLGYSNGAGVSELTSRATPLPPSQGYAEGQLDHTVLWCAPRSRCESLDNGPGLSARYRKAPSRLSISPCSRDAAHRS